MRIFILGLVMALAHGGFVAAQSSVDEPDVRDTIASQIEAFRDRDAGTAFTFASPFIQRQFGTAENFGLMVQRGYPMVWDPAEFAFVDQIERNGAIWQRLQVIDKSGTEHWFAYEMVQIDGRWRINGVYPLEAPDLSV